MRLVIFLGGEVQALDGYVLVNNERVPDVETGRKILAAVDEALRKTGLRSVMFDTRDLPPPPDAVNRVLRAWVDAGANHDRVALLVRSDLKRIASNMRAQSKGVELRSAYSRGVEYPLLIVQAAKKYRLHLGMATREQAEAMQRALT